MPLTKTPICDFTKKAKNFVLESTDNEMISLNSSKGKNGTLIMFICNHCPYVKSVIKEIVHDTNELKKIEINSIAIMSNDTDQYPEDSFENMKKFSKKNNLNFPYLIDKEQVVAKSYGAVCTPDFFGFNNNFELKYRGRIRELKNLKAINSGDSDLYKAMKQIAETGKGPKKQAPSLGCSIKWFKK
jgi:peroxiredoxin